MPFYSFSSTWIPAPRPTPGDATLLAIGDVHGHLDHLEAMLSVLAPVLQAAQVERRRSELVMIGDYVDRGPSSLAVLDLVAGLEARLGVPVHALRGNHDLYLEHFLFAEAFDPSLVDIWCINGGTTTLAELGVRREDLLTRDPLTVRAAARERAGQRVLGLLQRLELSWSIGDYVFVHAGVHPARSLAEHKAEELLWLREPFLSAGTWVHPFAVVHGHTIRGPEVCPHRVGIDSGAYGTGVLTAVELADDRLRFHCVSDSRNPERFWRLPGIRPEYDFTLPEEIPGTGVRAWASWR